MNLFRNQFSIIIFLLLFAGYQATNDGNEETNAQESKEPLALDYRLPKSIIPIKYEIILRPTLTDTFNFKGVVNIDAYVKESTDTIKLHRGNLDINMQSVTSGNVSLNIVNSTYNEKTEIYEIKLRDVLPAETNILINFDYSGKLTDNMVGFYRSSYFDSKGKIRWLLSTQFEATYARNAFLCFDEPSFKAKFIVRILRPPEYTCLSNMPLNRSIAIDSGNSNGKVWDEFKQSIPMSTYLVAFVVSNFESVKANNFNVWARPNVVDQANYALSTGIRGLAYLAKRFNQSYQLPKMDMIAVPDFAAGAMENWGLITYRESRLLYDENSTSDVAKQTIASVVLHELTHMWFGNAISPEWWSYLWLNEAFATYFQYFGTAQVEQTWNMEDQFVVEQHLTAYAFDGIESSQPMTRNANSKSEVEAVGDRITYNKGGSIVRMMNLIFGSDVFDIGLQNYLNNNEEKVARPERLWTELQNVINRRNQILDTSVREIMTTWTEQAGFPVVNVIVSNGVASLQQYRFLLRNLKSTPTNVTWWVPITLATEEKPNFDKVDVIYWLKNESGAISIPNSAGWVVLNVQSSGFYRVNYDNASWYRIIDTLNSDNYQKIHVLNRAAIVDDLLNLARAGLVSYQTTLDGLRYLNREQNYLPYKAAISSLVYLDERLSGQANYYENFKKFVLNLISGTYKSVGYVDRLSDDRLTVLLRGELNKLACNYDHKGCVETFTEMFQQWRQYNISIKPNQRPVAYCMGAKHGTTDDWEFLWDQYYYSNSPTEQEVILRALSCTQNTDLLEKYLLYTLKGFEESRIRSQDTSILYNAVSSSSLSGAEFVLDFVAKYHAQMIEFFNGTAKISSILSTASQRFSTQQLVNKYENLIEERKMKFEEILESLKKSLDVAKYELQWLRNYGKSVDTWVIEFNEASNKDDAKDTMDYRLPTSIIPETYSIWISTNLTEDDNFTFTGTVNINAKIVNNTRNITLHSSGLSHKFINVLTTNNNVTKIHTKDKYDFLIIEFAQDLQIGQSIIINIEYTGYLNEEMRGFYRSSYIDDQGRKRWLAATHMEPVAARKMFPCFDEPAMKAKFVMHVVVPQNYSAISNMRLNQIYIQKNEIKTLVFEETPRMSTYLVALVISDFVSVKSAQEVYGVWARRNAISSGEYALSVMKGLVNFYENTLNINYSLPKLDMVALPDFVSGAMENWGLLTYKEKNLLFDSNLSTSASQQRILTVISHEISHQWFGNLVSPLWWNYIWLNEGFARFFQYFGSASMVPSTWSLESQFVVEQLHSAFEADSLTSTHAMTHDVYSPTEIRGIFDTISYAKSASVIRMMYKAFGPQIFYGALRNYLNKRQYDTGTPEDLFDAFKEMIMDEKVKVTISAILTSWTTQPGYPIVNAVRRNNRLELQQERFLLHADDRLTHKKGIWHIPIRYTRLSNPDFNETKPIYWFKSVKESILLPSDDWYLLNVQQSGYYRVNYDNETWQQIINHLNTNFESIHEINRAAIIDDLLNLGRAGLIDYDIVLSAAQYLKNENNYIPWRAFFNGLTYLYKQFEGKPAYDALVRYLSSILVPTYKRLGYLDNENDTQVTKLLRSYVRQWLCKLDLSSCRTEALLQFLHSSSNQKQFQPNIRSVSYCEAARVGNDEIWNRLKSIYWNSTFAAEKSMILESFACATTDVRLNELLQNATSKDSGIRNEDSTSVFSYVINASPVGVKFAIKFINENYNKMVNYYGEYSSIDSILNMISKNVFTDEIYVKYVHLLNTINEISSRKYANLKTYTDRANRELKWGNENIPNIYYWLVKSYPEENYRLPTTMTPLRYNISLSTYFAERNFSFTGNVRIELKRNVDYVSSIVLNSHNLEIKTVSVYQVNLITNQTKKLSIRDISLQKESQTLSVFMNAFLNAEIILDIDFEGVLNDDMEGFYRSYYLDNDKNIRWLATTQFEPIYARQAFPCFDEPSFKAHFVVNIERPADYAVLSNMRRVLLTPSDEANRVVESFEETVKMSTYLVAFVVSDFIPVGKTPGLVNIWGRPNIATKGEFAEITAMRTLDFLQLETNEIYILPKLDLVGIPDFSMGAMENWGLVTFREYGLFYDKDVTSAKATDYIITIIAHELAHMVYGNLVTCAWWEYIWLNEGFAEYMQWRLSHMLQPNYGFNDLFVVDELQEAMQSDSSPTTHAMNRPVTTPEQIDGVFDYVTYGKSSSVIRMISMSLKPETFTRATTAYLSQHRFNNTTPKDLWRAFDNAIKETNDLPNWRNVSFDRLMDGWTNEKGFPIVYASFKDGSLLLTQKDIFTNTDSDSFWIPITFTTSSKLNFENTRTNIWLGGYPIQLKLDKSDKWFIVNIQQSGYYRVNYDNDSWKRLILALKTNSTVIHATNRAQVIDDLLNLAQVGYVDYEIALNGTTYLHNEMNYLPWRAFFNGIKFLQQRFQGRKEEKLIEEYVYLLTSKVYNGLGFKDSVHDSHFVQLNRDLILSWTCRLNYADCVINSNKMFLAWRIKNVNDIPPNTRAAVYCTAIRSGSVDDWLFLWKQYQETNMASEQKIIMNSLGCSINKDVLTFYIESALTRNYTSIIRKQDVSAVLASVYNSGKIGVDVMLDFLVDNYTVLHDFYDNADGVKKLISKLTPYISTTDQVTKLNELGAKVGDVSSIAVSVNLAIENAKKNLLWYDKYSSKITKWLNRTIDDMNSNSSSTATVANSLSVISLTAFSVIVYMFTQ